MTAMTQRRSRINWPAVLMVAPAILTLLLVGVYPLIFALSLSMQKVHLTRTAGNWTFIGLDNFAAVLSDQLFRDSLMRTGVFLVVALIAQLLLGIAIALFLDYSRWRSLKLVVQVALVVPIAMTPAVVGLLGRLIYNRDFGLLNYLLGLVGVPPQSWLGDPGLAMVTLLVTDTWQWTPFAALVMISSLSMVPRETIEAVRLDSRGWWPIARYVQLPYMLPGITAFLIIRTAEILKLFDMPFILTRGGPGVSTELISLYVQRVGFRIFDMGLASAQAILLLIICIVLSRAYIHFFYREVEAVS